MIKAIRRSISGSGFRAYLLFFLLFISRIFHLTKYKTDGEHEIALHPFQTMPFRKLYPWAVLFDAIIHYYLKVWTTLRLGYLVVSDRWIHDILVDVAIDTLNPDIFNTITGRCFYNIALKADVVLLLDADDQTLDERRPEARLDPHIIERRSLYRSFRNSSKVFSIRSSDGVDASLKNALEFIEGKAHLDFKIDKHFKVYADVKTPVFQRLLKKKYVMLASNWTFQGLLMAGWGERLFRAMLDLSFALLIFTTLSFRIAPFAAAMLSIIFAHTLNWSFNGNIWAILKHSGKKYDMAKSRGFLKSLRKRAAKWSRSSFSVLAFGSLSRGKFGANSDIDLRIIRKTGVACYIKANLFALYLRSTAFIRGIPLDLLCSTTRIR